MPGLRSGYFRLLHAGRWKRQAGKIIGKATGWFPQADGGLGERMYTALADVLGRGYGSCLLVGTDVPELRRESLEKL